MSYSAMQASILHMLHAQHRYYTSELGTTHKELGIQYKRLAEIELGLIQRHERNLSRQEKKNLQWARGQTRSLLKSLESQQSWLRDYLRQCNDLIASCDGSIYYSPVTPLSALPTTESFSPVSGSMSPFLGSAAALTPSQVQLETPQYWDLSTLRERRESSPFAPSWSADSGFYDAHISGQPTADNFSNPFSNSTEVEVTTAAPQSPPSKKSSISEKDNVPDLIDPVSPARSGAQAVSRHRRRYSENAIQLIESRLPAPKETHHRRGTSASATPVPHRTLSEHLAIG